MWVKEELRRERMGVEEEVMSGCVSNTKDEKEIEVHSSDPYMIEMREDWCCKTEFELILREERMICPEDVEKSEAEGWVSEVIAIVELEEDAVIKKEDWLNESDWDGGEKVPGRRMSEVGIWMESARKEERMEENQSPEWLWCIVNLQWDRVRHLRQWWRHNSCFGTATNRLETRSWYGHDVLSQ